MQHLINVILIFHGVKNSTVQCSLSVEI